MYDSIEVYTIGVYGTTKESFFHSLVVNGIDTFCDIRQRRGVRGTKYAYVNSMSLQSKLSDLGINYIYAKDLAPTTEIREKQHAEDALKDERKRDRKELGHAFKCAYEKLILEGYDFTTLLNSFQEMNARKVVLFCVEENPLACHRSLVAAELHKKYKLIIKHI